MDFGYSVLKSEAQTSNNQISFLTQQNQLTSSLISSIDSLSTCPVANISLSSTVLRPTSLWPTTNTIMMTSPATAVSHSLTGISPSGVNLDSANQLTNSNLTLVNRIEEILIKDLLSAAVKALSLIHI